MFQVQIKKKKPLKVINEFNKLYHAQNNEQLQNKIVNKLVFDSRWFYVSVRLG